jgi:hypothetical protein
MQPGPYTPGEIAGSVPGRMLRLSEFEDRLSYLVDLQKLIGRIRVDHAPRPHQDPVRSRINPHHHPRRRPARSLLRDRHWNGRDTTRPRLCRDPNDLGDPGGREYGNRRDARRLSTETGQQQNDHHRISRNRCRCRARLTGERARRHRARTHHDAPGATGPRYFAIPMATSSTSSSGRASRAPGDSCRISRSSILAKTQQWAR